MLLLFNTASTGAVCRLFLLKGVGIVLVRKGAVVVLLEDWVSFDGLELGLEVGDATSMGGAVGTTASLGESVTVVTGFFARMAPIGKEEG